MSTKPELVASFTEEEVVALDKLMGAIRRRDEAEATRLARDPAVLSAHIKFLRMRARAKGVAS